MKLAGSVDERGRPTVRLETPNESLLVVVDTGFNGDLMLSRDAARVLGAASDFSETEVELGDGKNARVFEARTVIEWLGKQRPVRVLISDELTTHGDAPVGLLGTNLLAPHVLRIDFAEGSVSVEAED